MNKKGNFSDIGTYIEYAIVLFIVITFVLIILQGFNERIQAQDNETIPHQVKVANDSYTSWLPKGIDILFLFILLIFMAFSVMAARLIPSTPKFIFISLFAILVFPFIGMLVENIWDGFFQQSKISIALNGMTFMPFIMNNFRYVLLIYAIVVAIALNAKEGTS